MVLVLLLLCAFFSVVTYSEQSPSGAAAGRQLAQMVQGQLARGGTILIAIRDQPDDIEFARSLEESWVAGGGRVAGTASGEPKDARAILQRLATAGEKLDGIACTPATAAWLVFGDLKADFPSLGAPVLFRPGSYRWPNFLKSENLLNIANQIAVIAIVAIGMTLVIVTGGIDLSVGSLLALSAVLTAWAIRYHAGGVQAPVFGMVLSGLFAILVCGGVGAFSGFMITRFGIPPFIVTLAMMLVGSGLAYTIAKGQSIYQIPDSFVWLGRGADLFSLPNAVVLMIVLYVLAHVLMSRMKWGRYLYAVGGNREAARLSGVPVERMLLEAELLTVKRLSYQDAQIATLWDQFVTRCPEASFFHRAGWQKIVRISATVVQ